MTKQEALHQMNLGAKVAHRYFSDTEWMTFDDGMILFEDGVRCTTERFFETRNCEQWEDGYSIFEPPEYVMTIQKTDDPVQPRVFSPKFRRRGQRKFHNN